MPALDDPALEQFAMLRAIGTPYRVAYRDCGFDSSLDGIKNPASAGMSLAHRDDVRARVAELQTEYADELKASIGIDRNWVLSELVLNYRRSAGLDPIVTTSVDKDGAVRVQSSWHYNPSAVNKTLELLGVELGMFKRVHQLEGKDGGPIDVRNSFVAAVGANS